MLARITAPVVAAALGLALLLIVWVPTGSGADEEVRDEEVRVRVACASGTAELRVRAESRDGDDSSVLRVEVRVDTRRPFPSWRIVLLHERKLVYNGVRRTNGSRRRVRLRLTMPDWPGRETVTARLTANERRTCRLGLII